MLAKERHDRILKLLKEKGAVTTSGLVEKFGVSTETVRRDLAELERDGYLQKVHGGAVRKKEMRPNLDLKKRCELMQSEKDVTSMKALSLLKAGDVIAVDAGSTGTSFAKAISTTSLPLTVVTYSLSVFEILKDRREVKIILCGGEYSADEQFFHGALAQENLKRLHVQKAFITPSAISMDFGICEYDEKLVSVQRLLINSSDEVIVLADSSKFERKALIQIGPMHHDYTYVTDDELGAELKWLYKNNGYNII